MNGHYLEQIGTSRLPHRIFYPVSHILRRCPYSKHARILNKREQLKLSTKSSQIESQKQLSLRSIDFEKKRMLSHYDKWQDRMMKQRDSLTSLKSLTFHRPTTSMKSLSTDASTRSSDSLRTLSEKSGGSSRFSDEYSRLIEDNRKLDEAIRSITLMTLEAQCQGHAKPYNYNNVGDCAETSFNDTQVALPGSLMIPQEPNETRSQPTINMTDRRLKRHNPHSGDAAYRTTGAWQTPSRPGLGQCKPSKIRTRRKGTSLPLLPESEMASIPNGASSAPVHHTTGVKETDRRLSSFKEDNSVPNMWHQQQI